MTHQKQPPPQDVRDRITATLQEEYLAGRLVATAEAISQRAAELAQNAGYDWQPKPNWIREFTSLKLNLPKRTYRCNRAGHDMTQIMAFVRESLGPACSKSTLQDYRVIIAGFLRAGLHDLTALRAAQPSGNSNKKQRLAAWTHLCRFYEQRERTGQQQREEGGSPRGSKRPRPGSAAALPSGNDREGLASQALAVPMEVEDEGKQLLDQSSLQPAMALLHLASSSIASAPPSVKAPARQPAAACGITPMYTDGTTRSGERDEAVVASCTSHSASAAGPSAPMGGDGARPAPAAAAAAAPSSASAGADAGSQTGPVVPAQPTAATAPDQASRYSKAELREALRAGLQQLCGGEGQAALGVLVDKLVGMVETATQTAQPPGGGNEGGGSGGSGADEASEQKKWAALFARQQHVPVERLTYCSRSGIVFVGGLAVVGKKPGEEVGVSLGFSCEVTEGRHGHPEDLRVVGYQRSLAEYSNGRFRLALSYLRAITRTLQRHGVRLREGVDVFNQDQLIWVVASPARIVKLGGSASVAVFLALFARFMDRPLRRGTAAMGEIFLSGHVGSVDGVSAKLSAAQRTGFRRVVVPQDNWEEVEERFKQGEGGMEVLPAATVFEALNLCLEEGQEVPAAAEEELSSVVRIGMRPLGGGRVSTMECCAFPGTGKLIITGTEPQETGKTDTFDAKSFHHLEAAYAAMQVVLLWLDKVQDEDWFKQLPSGRRRFDLKRMLMWEEEPVEEGATGGAKEAADGQEPLAAANDSTSTAIITSTATSSTTKDSDSSGGPVQTVKSPEKADLHIWLPRHDNSHIGVAAVLALVQLMRGVPLAKGTVSNGEVGPDGRLFTCLPPKEPVDIENLQRVITPTPDDEHDHSLPKAAKENVRVSAFGHMKDAVEYALYLSDDDEEP